MIDVECHVDLRQVEAGLLAMANERTVGRAMQLLRRPMRADQRDHARKAEGPDSNWPKRKLGGRRRLLGRLPAALAVVATKDSVSAISRVKWSAIHQEGGVAGRGAKIPARPFLWISDGLMTAAADALARAVAEAF